MGKDGVVDNLSSNSSYIPSEQLSYVNNKDKAITNDTMMGACQIDSLSNREVANNKSHRFITTEPNFESVQTSPADSSYEDPRDMKYKEKRQKNNLAAKKSRDARKIRENQLKVKVICLENANEVLRAQVHREQDEKKAQKERIEMLEKQINDMKHNRKCPHCSIVI